MSPENVDIVRRGYELNNALGRTGDAFVDPEEVAPEFWSRLAPDFELHDRPELPDAKVYRGPEEAKEFWRKTQQVFSEVRWEPQEFIDLGHAVVVASLRNGLRASSSTKAGVKEILDANQRVAAAVR